MTEQGWRYQMSNLMAVIGREQLKKIKIFSQRRQILANRYVSELRQIPNLTLFDFDYKNLVPHVKEYTTLVALQRKFIFKYQTFTSGVSRVRIRS